eukprot:TRINITY_DN23878_c0_g1_i1.p1 TRINITY_DN23878_c0_g1~~TRINITY_DN23878_c0_g1_i1.p1  ORF type:complete len:338 (+),score=36.79 TRINITY_DN23878_c0_g1_i1:145-1158(+)
MAQKYLQARASIDSTRIEEMLLQHMRVICCVDGSTQSTIGFIWVVKGLMQNDRETDLQVVHYFDESKEYLPPKWRKGAIESMCSTVCTSYLLPDRYKVNLVPKGDVKVGERLCELVKHNGASFVVMGFQGRKGKDLHLMGSNVMEVMQRGRCSCIIIRNRDERVMPLARKTKFVVSTSLNPAATKAFVDALRLSRKGDEIHIVYVRPFLEPHDKECEYTQAIRTKYETFFGSLSDSHAWPTGKMIQFADRDIKLHFTPQGRGEGIPGALVRYASDIDADFVMVGTNALRVERGKEPVCSVSKQIIMEWSGNAVVSSYNPDLDQVLRLRRSLSNKGGC